MRTFEEYVKEGWGAAAQKREREMFKKEWDHFRSKLKGKEVAAYDKLRGLRGEAAYHRVKGGDERTYRVGMYR